MEQGCPHRSILPHIFPDCNSFAIKIGGKFCGVRGVCPGGAACLDVAGAAGVSGTRRGACRLCRLPTLPLALFSCPHPPAPFPAGRGRFFVFLCKGLRPLHPRAEPARHWLALPLWKTQWGLAPALPARRVSAVPGGGACPGVAGSAGVSGTRREACLLCRLLTLPLAYFFAPIPPTPFPAGRGRFFVFLCKGLRPLHPRG